MPKTKRDLMKRQLAHAYMNLERSLEHLNIVRETFAEQHTEYAAFLQAMMETVLFAQNNVRLFCIHAWGIAPSDFETWRATDKMTEVVDNGGELDGVGGAVATEGDRGKG